MILRIQIGGFALSPETFSAMEALKVNRLLFRCGFDIQQGDIAFAVQHLADKRTPNLLIVEVGGTQDEVFESLGSLADVCEPDTRVILVGTHNDIEFYRQLISQGISDYLIAPITTERLQESIMKVFSGRGSDYDGRVIAFMGVEGGVGSSVIAHNVARHLSDAYEARVAVVDLDVSFGTAALNVNQQPRQSIVDALNHIGRGDEDQLDQYFTRVDDNFMVLASPASLTLGNYVRPEAFDALMRAVRPMADFIILDLPHFWTTWVTDALAYADETVLVARPELSNLRDAKSLMEYLGPKRTGDAVTRLILNQVGCNKKNELTKEDFRETVALDPAAEIPYDPDSFGRAMNAGNLLVRELPKCKASAAICEFAEVLSGRQSKPEKAKKSIWPFWGGKQKKKAKQ